MQKTQEAINMKLGSNSLLNMADKYSTLAGAGGAALQLSDSIQAEISKLLQGHIHAPNFNLIKAEIGNNPAYKTAVLALVAGWAAKESGIGFLKKIGDITTKASTGYLAVRGAELVLASMTNPWPERMSGAGSSSSLGNRGY